MDGAVLADRRTGFPSTIKYIVGNEACERFSYYGMRSILVIFMVKYLLLQEGYSKGVFHLFVSANYFLPLLGGFISDRLWGKYKTILYLSLFYCAGHAVLAMFESPTGLYWGLALIAFGSGGIKPCVSAYVGDQFTESNKHLISKVFDLFYFSINFGSFFSSLLIPWILPKYGPSVAFGIPGVLMGLATLIFWMGRSQYINVPPTGKENSPRFFEILWYALTHLSDRQPGQNWLDTAKAKFPADKVDGAKAAVAVGGVFLSVSAFWSLYDQTGSSWVLQAEKMNRTILGITLESSQIQALNPILVMALIPIFSFGLYPLSDRLGYKMTPLRKMAIWMLFTGLSFVICGVAQVAIDHGAVVSVGWQCLAYVILTCSEVMVSITGLEFAYTQAPRAMKSTMMSLWLLTVSVGNLWTALIEFLNRFHGAMEFFFFAVLMFIVAGVFIAIAARYQYRNYVESGG
jgi:POT family proton-dependent oligopeptide transporter